MSAAASRARAPTSWTSAPARRPCPRSPPDRRAEVGDAREDRGPVLPDLVAPRNPSIRMERLLAAVVGREALHECVDVVGVLGRHEPLHESALIVRHQSPPRSRSLKRWILPVAVFGSSPTNSIQRGYLYGVMRSLTNAFSSSAS